MTRAPKSGGVAEYASASGWLPTVQLVWVANVYMGAYVELRLEIKHDRQIIEATEQEMKENGEEQAAPLPPQPIQIKKKTGS